MGSEIVSLFDPWLTGTEEQLCYVVLEEDLLLISQRTELNQLKRRVKPQYAILYQFRHVL